MRHFGLFLVCSVLIACGATEPAAPDGIFFPTLTERESASMAALIAGTLFEDNGCLLLNSDYRVPPNNRVLMMWPFAAGAERTGSGTLQILHDGAAFAETGEHVELGGGFVGESRDAVGLAQDLTGTTIPDRCRADAYWLVSPPS